MGGELVHLNAVMRLWRSRRRVCMLLSRPDSTRRHRHGPDQAPEEVRKYMGRRNARGQTGDPQSITH